MRIDEIGAATETSAFEVTAEIDEDGHLTASCATTVSALVDEHGFAIIRGVFDEEEAESGLRGVKDEIANQDREQARFASQTDTLYKRRDFCPLPANGEVFAIASLLGRRTRPVLEQYCGTTRSVLEISTLTSYQGCSHQYIHRDPKGVLCLFAVLDDISPTQGGTVFVPGTHSFSGSANRFDGRAEILMRLFQVQCNTRILFYNLRKLVRMRLAGSATLSTEEFKSRVFSRTATDNHQPNIARFLSGRNLVFGRQDVGLRTLIRQFQHGEQAAETFELVQASPAKGDVIVYRSDVLHAGPDNRSEKPRFYLNVNIARDVMHPDRWREAYAPHSSLLESPLTLADLLQLENASR